jgi:pantothenate synthetase
VRRHINEMPSPVIDYVTVVDESTLAPVGHASGACRILVVARVEGVRLLDNIALD